MPQAITITLQKRLEHHPSLKVPVLARHQPVKPRARAYSAAQSEHMRPAIEGAISTLPADLESAPVTAYSESHTKIYIPVQHFVCNQRWGPKVQISKVSLKQCHISDVV